MDLSKLKDLKNKQQKIIADYLLKVAQNDECLMNKLLETDKTIQGCISYINKEALKQVEDGLAFLQNEVVYEWAKHYFLEDSLNSEPKGNKKAQAKPEEEAEEIDDIESSDEGAEIEEKEEPKPVKQKKTKIEKIKDKLYDGLDLFSMEEKK